MKNTTVWCLSERWSERHDASEQEQKRYKIRLPLPRQDRNGGFCTFEGSIVQGINLQKNIVWCRKMWYNKISNNRRTIMTPQPVQLKLSTIEANIENGLFVIPNFQRDFVWEIEKSAKNLPFHRLLTPLCKRFCSRLARVVCAFPDASFLCSVVAPCWWGECYRFLKSDTFYFLFLSNQNRMSIFVNIILCNIFK